MFNTRKAKRINTKIPSVSRSAILVEKDVATDIDDIKIKKTNFLIREKYIKDVQLTTLYFALQWLAWRDGFRTMNWREAVGDIETTIKEIKHLLALV